ncbi:MAG: ABC transporter substrate-binding protein [Blautia sp.]|nr:ABC transporter substrate-binding protein [Blautia sp.]MDY3999958.1 ABC transporter substrate-binding protein [Blautia sp.]
MNKRTVRKTIASVIAATLAVTASVPVFAESEENTSSEIRQVTDAAGNVVEVPADISKIAVTPLPWSSVIFAIDGTSERMTSVNPGAMTAYTGHFFEKLDSHYGELDTSNIGKDFSINMEALASDGVQACVIWDYQTDEAKQLSDIGITPVMVKNETVEELQESFRAIGELLGKEERAQEFIDLYGETYDEIKSYQDQVAEAEKPKVLYLRNSELKLQGNDNFIKEAMEMAGADNVAADASDISMEEILEINPDIIFLSWFDGFTPDDLYENRIDGQDWSTVNAVINKKVYKTPLGIYRWDAPGVETPLMMKWLAAMIQPEIFADIDMKHEVTDYFQDYFEYSVTDEDYAQIMCDAENTNSVK